jgi:hypothetical protein
MKVVRAAPLLLLLLDLDDQLLAFLEQILDVLPALGRYLRAEVLLRDLLQRQEAVALSAIFDERSLETRLYPGDAAFINVGFFLFPGGDLNR